MYIDLIPIEYSKSGGSIRFTSNGFQQYWIKVSALNCEIIITPDEDWDNKYRIEYDEDDMIPYGKNYFRINEVESVVKL